MKRFKVELSCRLFPLQTNLPFLLKVRHLLVTLGLAEAFRPCYEYFESSEKEHSSQLLCLGCLPLSCPACVPYVKWVFWVGSVCVSLFIYLCMLMVETEGRRWVSITTGCSCLDFSYLLWVFSFHYCAWDWKSSSECRIVLAWVLRKELQSWLRTEWKNIDGGFLCVTLNYNFFPIN